MKMYGEAGLGYGLKDHGRDGKIKDETISRTHQFLGYEALFPGNPSQNDDGKYGYDGGQDSHVIDS